MNGNRRRFLVLLYSVSGAAALVYEVVWTRLLALQLGHTVAAASTVLAAFMGGLAIGAWIAGRWVGHTQAAAKPLPPPSAAAAARALRASEASEPREGRAAAPAPGGGDLSAVARSAKVDAAGPYLAAYAALEIAIAIAALLLPVMLRLSTPVLAWAYADGAAPLRFGIVRVALSAILVGIPAAAM